MRKNLLIFIHLSQQFSYVFHYLLRLVKTLLLGFLLIIFCYLLFRLFTLLFIELNCDKWLNESYFFSFRYLSLTLGLLNADVIILLEGDFMLFVSAEPENVLLLLFVFWLLYARYLFVWLFRLDFGEFIIVPYCNVGFDRIVYTLVVYIPGAGSVSIEGNNYEDVVKKFADYTYSTAKLESSILFLIKLKDNYWLDM